jgi:hypothetical protein
VSQRTSRASGSNFGARRVALASLAGWFTLVGCGGGDLENDELAHEIYWRQGYSLKSTVECFGTAVENQRYNRVCDVRGGAHETLYVLVSGTDWQIVKRVVP